MEFVTIEAAFVPTAGLMIASGAEVYCWMEDPYPGLGTHAPPVVGTEPPAQVSNS